nr:hypothetical protein [Tanacetum cinerariifolium]
MVLRRVMGVMMGCLGMSCLRRSDQATRPLSPAPSESCDDSLTASSDDVKSSSSSETSKESSCGRIKLSDGRLLAYKERGVPKSEASYRVVIVHGFASSKEMNFMASQKLIDELGIYLLQFDRAGYGESDPNPKRSLKSEASDIEELADQLQLGSKFYIVGVSVGSYPTWSCVKNIPERLAGVALVKMFPSSSVLDRNVSFFSTKDMEVVKNTPGYQLLNKSQLKEEPIFHSLCKDIIVAFGKWDFDPLSLTNPFGGSECRFHIWQGYEDKVVPVELQRYISTRLPWIKYREVPDGGHLLVYDTDVCEAILRSLLLGEDTPLYIPKFDSN